MTIFLLNGKVEDTYGDRFYNPIVTKTPNHIKLLWV